MEEIFFCPGCMAKTAPVDGKCPVCGCNVNMENAPHQLPAVSYTHLTLPTILLV